MSLRGAKRRGNLGHSMRAHGVTEIAASLRSSQ